MKKQKRLVVGVIAGVVVLVVISVGGYGGWKLMIRHRVQQWKTQGIAASKAGNHEQAIILLKQYLEAHPTDIEAVLPYIDSLEKADLPGGQENAELISAIKTLTTVEPRRLDDRRHLAELYLKINRRPEALDTINALLEFEEKMMGAPHDVQSLAIKTQIQNVSAQYSDALRTANEWIGIAPDDLAAQMAWFLADARSTHASVEIVAEADQRKDKHPGDPHFELLAGYARVLAADILEEHDVQERSRRDDESKLQIQKERDLRNQAAELFKAAASHPDPSEFFVTTLVKQLEGLNLAAEAVAVLQEADTKNSTPALHRLLICRLWQEGQWANVIAATSNLDLKNPKTDSELIAFKAMALAFQQKKSEADACRDALKSRDQASARAWTALLRRLIEQTPIDDKQVIADCRLAIGADPSDFYLAYFMGDCSARLGESEIALDMWKRVAANNPTWSAPLVRLVELLLQKGLTTDAYAIASRAARSGIRVSAPVAVVLARAMAADVDTGEYTPESAKLLEFVKEIQSQLPNTEQTLLIQIRLLAEKNDRPQAIQQVQTALAKNPPFTESFLIAMGELSHTFSLGVEDQCFDASEKAWGITPALAYARAAVRLAKNPPETDVAMRIFDGQSRLSGKEKELGWQIARARILEAVGDPRAKNAWIALADANPDNPAVQQTVAVARTVCRDWDFMQRTIERLKKLTGPNALAWRMALARLQVESARGNKDSDYNDGVLTLDSIIKENPRLPEARMLMASALMHLKQTDAAIKQLEAAYEADPSSVQVALELAALLESRGDDRSIKVLDQVSNRLTDPHQRELAAVLFANRIGTDRAVSLLEKPANPNAAPGAFGDLFLAQLYFRTRQFDKADALFKKLLENPNPTAVQFATNFYLYFGRRGDAANTMALLDKMSLKPGEKELLWAAYYLRLGDIANSTKQYQSATEKTPGNPIPWRMMIASLFSVGKVDTGMAAIQSAARALPDDKGFALLTGEANLSLIRDAMTDPTLPPLVITILRDGGGDDVQSGLDVMRALIPARRSNQMEQMAEQLAQLAIKHPGFLPLRLQLIQCYAEMQRFADAYSAAQKAMEDFPTISDPAKVVVAVCVKAANAGHPMWAQMDSAAQAWKKRSPDEAIAADTADARAKIEMDQPQVALQLLEPYLPLAKTMPDQLSPYLVTYCIALGKAGRSADAENLLRPLAASSPVWRTHWFRVAMAFLPDSNLATSWLEKLVAMIPAPTSEESTLIAGGYDMIGRKGQPPRPELLLRSNEWFNKIVDDPKAPIQDVLAAASSFDVHGDTAKAIVMYRRALTLDPNLPAAQNNLAVLLAQNGGNMQEAEALALSAIKFMPHQAAFHDTLAEVRAKAGQIKAAADAERVAINLEPENPKWRLRLADYLISIGDVNEATKVAQPLQSQVSQAPNESRQQLELQLSELNKRFKSSKATMSKAG